jgi:hypothetical protein
MTGTITNLDSGESRDYGNAKERGLIIRAWQRLGCWGVQIRPNVPSEYVQTEAGAFQRKMHQRYYYLIRYWRDRHGRKPPITRERYIELVQQYGTIKKAEKAKQL